MGIYETIISRRTIRKFKQEKIDIKILKKIVNAGRLAPSAANLQPLEYLIVDDEDLKNKVFPDLAWAGYIKPEGDPGKGEEPAAYIIILVDKKINPAPERDIGASVENMNLVAQEEGVGCCWIGAFNPDATREVLSLPDYVEPIAFTPLGYPDDQPGYKSRKSIDKLIRYERW